MAKVEQLKEKVEELRYENEVRRIHSPFFSTVDVVSVIKPGEGLVLSGGG